MPLATEDVSRYMFCSVMPSVAITTQLFDHTSNHTLKYEQICFPFALFIFFDFYSFLCISTMTEDGNRETGFCSATCTDKACLNKEAAKELKTSDVLTTCDLPKRFEHPRKLYLLEEGTGR